MKNKFIPWLVGLLSAIPFLPCLAAKFVKIDDDFNYTHNLFYRGFSGANLKWMFAGFQLGGVYQPLSWVTNALDWRVWGLNPLGYHLTNVLLISLTAAVVYSLSNRILRLTTLTEISEANMQLCAAFSALAWAVHPLRVEAVAWASNRSYVLPGLFYFLAIDRYFKSRSEYRDKFNRDYFLCVVSFAMSLLSKAIGMTLPLVLLVADWYPLRRLDPFFNLSSPGRIVKQVWSLILEKWPLFTISAVSAAVAARGRYTFGAMIPVSKFGWTERLANATFSLSFYLEKTLVPLRLSPMYPLPTHLHPLDDLCAPRTIFCVAVTILAVAYRRQRPWLLAAWAAWVITLLPFLGVSQYGLMLQIAADKWCYLAGVIPTLLAGGYLSWLISRANTMQQQRRILGLAMVTLLILGSLSWAQTRTWRDSETLFLHAIEVEPECYFCHNNVSVEYQERGDYVTALAHSLEALRIKPDYDLALANASVSYSMLGMVDQALAVTDRQIAIGQGDANVYFQRGFLLGKQGKWEAAVSETRHAIFMNQNMANAHNNLGYFLERQGKIQEAEAEYIKCLGLDPGMVNAKNNLENLLMRSRKR